MSTKIDDTKCLYCEKPSTAMFFGLGRPEFICDDQSCADKADEKAIKELEMASKMGFDIKDQRRESFFRRSGKKK